MKLTAEQQYGFGSRIALYCLKRSNMKRKNVTREDATNTMPPTKPL